MHWPWPVLVSLLPALIGLSAWGGDLERGLGSRALARGGTCVAWADEATAGSCNPAGPAMLEGIHLLVGLAPRVSPTAEELKLLSGAARWGPFALSGFLSMSSTSDGTRELWASSFALRARERLSLGVGVKRYHQSLGGAEATQVALDFGVLYKVMDSLLLGVNFGNAVRGELPSITPLTRVGARLGLGWLRGSGELALSPGAPPQWSFGAELWLFAPFILRLGYADDHKSFGLGFDSGRLNADFALLAAEEGVAWMLSTEVVFHG